MSANLILPRFMEIGRDALQQLPKILKQCHLSAPLIITDPVMIKLGYGQQVQGLLADHGLSSEIFDQTEPEPTAASIQAGLDKMRTATFDVIIALGGGSPIDSAKAIAMLAKQGGAIQDYKFPRVVDEPGIPIVAIPTTAGTGSEVTRFTIITDEQTDEKMLCVGAGFVPFAAIVDANLSVSVPPRTTADTGIDAMTHAIEAYVSKKASPYSDQQALAALRLIGPHLKQVYHQGDDLDAREAMMLGSTLAGIAFSTSSVALVHGMSRPIGAFFHVPHGLSNAMLLPAVTKFSIPGAPERYADCAKALGIIGQGASVAEATHSLLQFLEALNTELKVPTLKVFGATKEHFDEVVATMAQQAEASGSPGNNPKVPTQEEMITIYQSLWE